MQAGFDDQSVVGIAAVGGHAGVGIARAQPIVGGAGGAGGTEKLVAVVDSAGGSTPTQQTTFCDGTGDAQGHAVDLAGGIGAPPDGEQHVAGLQRDARPPTPPPWA